MTHSGGKPHRVGDQGQRFEVRATGWPADKETVVCWTATVEAAHSLMTSILKAPGCRRATIHDRQEKKDVITRYGGPLR